MSWEHLSDHQVRARKRYNCCWCGESITLKSVHHICTGKAEGEFQSNRFHTECWNAALEYFRAGDVLFEAHSFKRGSTEER